MTNINNISKSRRLYENEEDFDYCDPETEDCEGYEDNYEDVSDDNYDTDESKIKASKSKALKKGAKKRSHRKVKVTLPPKVEKGTSVDDCEK
jgi:hypothetical protein